MGMETHSCITGISRRIELWMETVYREIYVVSGLEYLKIKEKMIEEKKEPTIKTLVDTGTTINFVDFGNGRQAFIFREEKFGRLQIWGVRLGWSENYRVIAPEALTCDTISVLSAQVTNVSGEETGPEDFEVHVYGYGHAVDVARVEKEKQRT